MKPDIRNRQDIEHFVDEFYKKVVDDEIIGYIFNRVAGFNWEKHIPVMYSFWETVLFGVMSYKGRSPCLRRPTPRSGNCPPARWKAC